MNNPEFFFGRSHENAIVDLKNDILLNAHLECATCELPLMKEEISDTHKRLLELWIKYDEELLAIIKKNRIKEKK